LILGDAGGPVTVDEIPNEPSPITDGPGSAVISPALATLPLREARETFERDYLMTQINRFGGNISKTASFVGMERSALHRKLKSLGVVSSAKSISVGSDEDS
jgi:two-component system nitrogen regulation response regulator NtrX